MKKKTTHTQEFRETAVRLALSEGKSTASVARELGIPEWKLYSWVSSWRKKTGKSKGQPALAGDAQLKELQRRYRELELENEILKKAAAYFAKTLL